MSEPRRTQADGLADVIVVETGSTPAGSFAANMLADFGATVIVVEEVGAGAPLRRLGPGPVRQVWWKVIGRNKQSIALNFATEDAAGLLDRLLARADMVIDDTNMHWFRDGLERCHGALVLSLFPPGADKPQLWKGRPTAELAFAATGAMALTGEADAPPVQPEFPLTDYACGLMAASLALFELRAARQEGRAPNPLRLGLHEVLLRLNEWQLVFASALGRAETRNGNRYPMNANVGNVFPTLDGALITVSAATDTAVARLLTLVGGAELARDPRFVTQDSRRLNMDALEHHVGAWMAANTEEQVLTAATENDVVMAPLYDAERLLGDPQAAARRNVLHALQDGSASLAMPGIIPKIAGMADGVRSIGPDLGADSEAVLAWLGCRPDEIARFRARGLFGAPLEERA